MGKTDISPPISERTWIAVIGFLSNPRTVRIKSRAALYLSERRRISRSISSRCFSNSSMWLRHWGTFLFPCHSGHRNVVCCEYKHIDRFQPQNNFPAQSLHFRFGSVAPCPTLKSDVTASTPRTRYGRLARPYPTGFSCYIQSAYKSKQSFLRSLVEISYADFTARTLNLF